MCHEALVSCQQQEHIKRNISMKRLAVLSLLAILPTPAFAGGLVAIDDVVLCKYLVDLEQVELRWSAQDKAAVSLYLEGINPPCMSLRKGELVEVLDQSGKNIQVVTRHGTPRFIGWGKQVSFDKAPQ